MKLLLIVTGSLRAAFIPFEINWIRMNRPEIDLRVVRTRSARAFVTRPALQQLCSRGLDDDEWDPERVGPALHVELGMWADAVLVYPATLDYVGRIARGEGDTPSLLTIACSTMPVAVAPALPPGGFEGRTYARHVEDIERLPGVAVVPPKPGYSAATRTMSTYTSADISDCLSAIDRMVARTAEPAATEGSAPVVPIERHR